ncbi:hypothetical protein Scep_016718 [Stephania cephalantha]|uniref:Transposase n=1 Tax=Stephania cephalantha TaxID=152367 RepID=A0AAP0INQ0_9MAGN
MKMNQVCYYKSINFIGKVMFLVVLALPRFDELGNEIFSEKFGVFPFVTQEAAKRSSVNRPAGIMETKRMTGVKRETIKSYMVEKLIPAIKEKWPVEDIDCPILIQQDNARTHIDVNDVEFHQAAQKMVLIYI